ncbi:flagellar protein FlaF [Methanosarcina sp. 2.H.T.1A.6]|uniref:flagellar protein FlaF n=1 Tax=unclassified Methanosarcina TaxID=2644672 RepID=UPI00062232F3|nr:MULTISPECIES: flagellar protein FlaF [unclassified Methanosarcina]KKG15611.1 flagellar protein FlaF [Methanosarcina sp. 2.H.T.1A.3]KKG19527.1 flagellar protein FlaF [Methanosarcina sp. 2.H.T.1A.6]KKG27512.1 flagellar protein FlaF [Methanosarcina sp. 2.H.T.1A.8]KKG28445.1 flagellar protein FlaF [Methanosarcina sp. 2.H.T.1A.15]
MGLDTVIVAFFVVGTILVVAGTVTMGTSNLLESSYDGYVAIHETTMNRLHTSIEIQNIRFNVSTNLTSFTVVNTGETKLIYPGLWDVILVKNGTVSYLNKSQYNMTSNKEIINPGILDPHESINVELLIDLESNDSFIVKTITENGIVSSAEHVAGE